MKLKDKEAWDKWVASNTDPYGGACVKVAQRVMEILDDGEPFDCHAVICRADDESKAGGITGFMAGAVASMVSQCHERGEEFRRQWNGETALKPEHAEKANASGGVINPAILHIG
jgi:hypothetical protein